MGFRQERRGRPGAATRYRRDEKPVFTISARVRADALAYHYQPNLERRNHMLKGPQDVAPVYLETPHHIEALLLCHVLALLTEALIEGEIRTSMQAVAKAMTPYSRCSRPPQ